MDTKKFETSDLDVQHHFPSGCALIRAEITADAVQTLVTECRTVLPGEACGVLASPDEDGHCKRAGILRIAHVYPIGNNAERSRQAFTFDPQDWIAALYQIRKNRQTLAGFYHSHPATSPVPSRSDHAGLQYAAVPSYWIVSFAEPDLPAIRPYIWDGASFVPLMLTQISV